MLEAGLETEQGFWPRSGHARLKLFGAAPARRPMSATLVGGV